MITEVEFKNGTAKEKMDQEREHAKIKTWGEKFNKLNREKK